MPETFNFRRSCQLLQINPKSFQEWLKKAGIDPHTQVNRADPREKYLTKEQLLQLAELHGRTLPPLDDDVEQPGEAMTIEALAEQLGASQRQHAARFDQMEGLLLQIVPLLQEIASKEREPRVLPEDAMQRFDHLQHMLTQITVFLQHDPLDPHSNGAPKPMQQTPEPVPVLTPITRTPATPKTVKQTAAPTKAKPSAKKKKPTRGKKLPAGLVLLREFAGQHHIVTERASDAGRVGKMRVVRGKWLVNSRWATEALDAQGQHDFYAVFHEREGFTPCEQCPHALFHVS